MFYYILFTFTSIFLAYFIAFHKVPSVFGIFSFKVVPSPSLA